ncbi:MAG TPA: DUF4157 domain-containing protein, partial [Polyangiaceae bacterium]
AAETVAPGQLRKTEFLTLVRAEVTSAADAILESAGRSTRDCPYLQSLFGFLAARDVRYLERTLTSFDPHARVETPLDYVPAIVSQVRASTQAWLETGRITGLPAEVPSEFAGLLAAGARLTRPTQVAFKGKPGGARAANDAAGVQAQLGPGAALDTGVQTRLGGAMGEGFSGVRVHTDATAAALASQHNARAFTVGEHVAFGSGEYQPGSPAGDALIAHELAHVIQQRGASAEAPAPANEGSQALEHDADAAAATTVATLWGGAKQSLTGVGRTLAPRLRSGLRLSRCKDSPSVSAASVRAALAVRTSGTTSPDNDTHFTAEEGGDGLGAVTDEDDGITSAEALGKVEVVATLPEGAPATGWDIKRTATYQWASNGTFTGSGTDQEDTSAAFSKDLTPSADRKIYDIDGPSIGRGFNVHHTKEVYDNFEQWVTLNDTQVSDKVQWHYHARVDDDLDAANRPRNDDTEQNDVGTGHRTIPGTPHYPVR